MNIIDEINKEQLKTIPEFSPGDDIIVQVANGTDDTFEMMQNY